MGSFEMLHEKKAQKLVAETGEEGILRIRMQEDASMLHPTHMTSADRIPLASARGKVNKPTRAPA